jgi:hypothetical protein
VAELQRRGAVLLGHEIYTHSTGPLDPEAVRSLVMAASLFSPNIFEAECLLESLRAARDGNGFTAPPDLDTRGDDGILRALKLARELSVGYEDQNILLRRGA